MLETATAIVALVGPFLPRLIPLGQHVAEKVGDVLLEKGGEAAWELAKSVWTRITGKFTGDSEIASAAGLVASKPGDEARRTILASILEERLKADPDFEKEIVAMLGGPKGVQKIVAGDEAWIEQNRQIMKGTGEQLIEGKKGAVIRGNVQEQGGDS